MKDGAPSVSVVMPAYDAEATIGEAAASLFAQTFSDWELVVVDDGSTDETADVVRGLSDPRVRLISLPKNMGNPVASNVGLKEARGKYVVVMDADDVSFPERIERQTGYLESHPDVDGCGSGHVVMTKCPVFDRLKARAKASRSSLLDADEAAAATLFGGVVYNPTMCFRRSILGLIPVWRDPSFRSGSDDVFYNRLIAAGARLVVLPDVLLRYRRLAGSNSRRFKTAAWDNRVRTALEAVHRLIPETTPEEERLHALVAHRDSSLSPEDLPGVRAWLSSLVVANREKGLFEEKALRKVLARHWERACAVAACRGFKAGFSAHGDFPLLEGSLASPLAFLYEWQKRKLGKKRGGTPRA